MRYENRLVVILFLTFGFVFFDRLALNSVFPSIAGEFGLTNTHLGLLNSALALSWAAAGLLVGMISDRMGRRKPLLIGAVVLFSLASLLSGFATGFVSLLLFRLFMGLAEGPVLPLCQSLMVAESSATRRGLNMGLIQSTAVGLMGALLGPAIVVPLAQAFGWRGAFYLSCLPGLAIALIIMWQVREPRLAASRAVSDRVTLATIVRQRNIWLSILISCVFVTWFIVITTFAPTYLIQTKGFTPGQMAMVMTGVGLGHVFWGFAVPSLSDRIGRKPAMIGFAGLSVLAPLAMVGLADPVAMTAAVALTYAGLGCFTLFMATIPAETVPAGRLATALGLVMGIGEFVGGVIAPAVAGYSADHLGATAPFWISAAGAGIAAILSLFLVETAPAKQMTNAAAAN